MVPIKGLVYRWDYRVSKGIAFIGGLELYKTFAESTQLPHYGLNFWRLGITWRQKA